MTALCGGGASSAQSGFGLGVTVGTGVLAALLNNVPTPQAVAIAAVIGVLNFELSSFCASDPPAMPTFTAQDYFDVLGGRGTLAQLAATDKFRAAVGNIVWPTFCKCDTVPTPAPPSFPAAPIGLPAYQPPQLPVGVASQPCWSASNNVDTSSGASIVDYSKLLWPTGDPSDLTPANNQRSTVTPLPTQVYFEIQTNPTGANGINAAQLTIRFLNSGFAEISRVTSPGGNVANPKVTGIPPAGTAHIEFDPSYSAPSFTAPVTGTATNIVKMWCAGQNPLQPTTPCCPPDPSLQSELDAIRSMLDLIYQSLPSSINSYSDGVAHIGLSGNGTITLVGAALGVRVNITTDPANLGVELGDPNYLFDRGFIVPIVNSAPIRSESRLVYNPQNFLLPSLTEQIGYSLHPGVVVTVTELLRGP